ncbi:hypothetical protein TSUD_74530 [Trifolium subterraneum]|nr:hypothetical protein TSUD_74530 [Trifolium subterraneum]
MIVEEEGVKKIKWKQRRPMGGGNGGGCGRQETEEHLFFNCPMLGATWRGIMRWIGIPVALAIEGVVHLTLWKNIVPGSKRTDMFVGTAVLVLFLWQKVFSIAEFRVVARREIPKCNSEAGVNCISISKCFVAHAYPTRCHGGSAFVLHPY